MTIASISSDFNDLGLEKWSGDDVLLIQQVESTLFEQTYRSKDRFILKKIVHGKLKENPEFYQCMIACQFNKARILSSISRVHVHNKEHHIQIYLLDGENSISYHLINLTKGGKDID